MKKDYAYFKARARERYRAEHGLPPGLVEVESKTESNSKKPPKIEYGDTNEEKEPETRLCHSCGELIYTKDGYITLIEENLEFSYFHDGCKIPKTTCLHCEMHRNTCNECKSHEPEWIE